MARKPYPSDVTDEEWEFVTPYLTLMSEDAPQREHDLREVFNGMRWIVRTGSPWRYMPNDLPPWEAVYQQSQRWLASGAAEAASKQKIELSVVKLPEAKRGFVLLPRRWVVERSFAWLARFRRLAKDYERLASTLKGMHLAAFAIVMLARLANWDGSS